MKGVDIFRSDKPSDPLHEAVLERMDQIGTEIRTIVALRMTEAANTGSLREVTIVGNALSNVLLHEAVHAITTMVAGAQRDDAFANACKEQMKQGVDRNFTQMLAETRDEYRRFTAQAEGGGTA